VFFVLKILFFSNRPGKVVGIRRNGTNNKNIDDTFQNKIIFFSRHFFVKKTSLSVFVLLHTGNNKRLTGETRDTRRDVATQKNRLI